MKKSNKEITDFYRTIKVKTSEGGERDHTLFDYEAMWEDEAPIFFIISERGAKGKSTQAKRLAKHISDTEGLKTMWIMNTNTLIDNEKISHLSKPKLLLENFENTRQKGRSIEKGIINEEEPDKTEWEWYTRFASLSTAENEKGSRDDFGLLIYDEFNVGLTGIKNQQTDLISSLIGTLSDPVNTADDKFKKMIIHGNNKSLNNQFLIDLDVLAIEDEITDVYVGDFLLMRILAPRMTESDREAIQEANKDNWKFKLQEKLGKAGHVYYNENLYDNINYVNPLYITLPVSVVYYIKIKNNYFEARISESADIGKILFFVPVIRNDIPEQAGILALNRDSVEESIILNTNIKRNFLKYLANERIYFFSAYVREEIIKEINR